MVERFISYLQYLFASRNRHGVHSPFVYSLLDTGINGNRGKPLLMRLQEYPGMDKVVVMHLQDVDPDIIRKDAIIYIPGIHKNKAASSKWLEISSDRNVQLSVDLWEGGLIVNRKDFKEKQHFVLRWGR